MRASLIPGLFVAFLTLASPVRAVQPGVGAAPTAAPQSATAVQPSVKAPAVAPPLTAGTQGAVVAPPAEPSDQDEAEDEDASAEEDSSGEDASDIQDDLNAAKKEMEELEKAELQAIPEFGTMPRHYGHLGAANPLRSRIVDSEHRAGELYDGPAFIPQGDAGGLLAEFGGMDLAALKAEYDIPIEVNAEVIQFIRFFQGPGRKWYTHWLERSRRWIPIMRPILAEEGVPLDLVYLAMIESGFSPYAVSWARASGFWQFISRTGRQFKLRDDFWVDERRDPILSTHAAARYLKQLHELMGDWYLAWASYNAGEGKLRRAIGTYNSRDFWELAHSGSYLRKETKFYVPKLIAAALIAKHPARFGFTDIVGETPFTYDEVELADATDLRAVARAAGISVEEVQRLNPALRRWCTPPSHNRQGYRIRLPAGMKAPFLAAMELHPDHFSYRYHRLSRGESLGSIAKKFHTAVEPILQLNGVTNVHTVRAGMDLVIPMPKEYAQHVVDSGAAWTEPAPIRRGHHGRSRWAAHHDLAHLRHGAKAKPVVAQAAGRRYVIHSGDTLWTIAHRFGVEVSAIKRWNAMGSSPTKLQVGKTINVSPPASVRTASVRKGRG